MNAGDGRLPSDLERLQRWMQSVITHPGGVTEGVESDEARAHLELGSDGLESVIARSQALTSAQRLEIYVDAYHERLLECLREEFPATRQALGFELFEAVAFGYLQHYPSQSYTLGLLGAQLSCYLDESRLHAHAQPDDVPASWPDFVIELAAFERLGREIFDGPGSEQLAALDIGALAAATADEAWERIGLRTAPCLRLAQFDHPIHTYWAASRRGEDVAPPRPRPTWLAIYRRDYAIECLELTPPAFGLLEALARGETLSAAIERALATPGTDAAWLEFELPRWFADWAARRLFVGG